MGMYLVFALWAGVVLGILTMHIRDTPHLLYTLLPFIPIGSPLMWSRDMLQQHQWVADWNPVYHFVEILRSAALDTPVPWFSWMTVATINLLGLLAAFVVYRHKRSRLGLLV
jgi:lipopolysaccharide transport system permease protein